MSTPRRGLLRDRNFALLISGETISELGTSITFLVFPLVAIATLHASAFAVGIVAAAGNAGWLVIGLPAGVWVDRMRRRPILIATDIGSAMSLVSVPVASAFDVLTVAQLAGVAFALSLLSVLYDVAYPAFLPSIVAEDRLVHGNGLMEASANGARIGGPGVGGILVQLLGAPVALLADAVSFLVAATTTALMRVGESRPVAVVEAAPTKFRQELSAGLAYVIGTPVVRALTVAATVGNFVFGGYSPLVILLLSRQLRLSAGAIGVLVAVGGIGGVLGALLAGPISARIGDARLLWTAAGIAVPCLFLVPMASRGLGLTWFVLGSVGETACIAAFNVSVRAAMQRTSPPSMLGRVTASARVFSRGALPLGALVGGALAAATSPRAALFTMLAVYVILPVVAVGVADRPGAKHQRSDARAGAHTCVARRRHRGVTRRKVVGARSPSRRPPGARSRDRT